jgi:hypothetical protein
MSVFQSGNLPRGEPEVDEYGLAEIGISKERHVAHNLDRPARCVKPTSCMLRSSGLIGCVYKMMWMKR